MKLTLGQVRLLMFVFGLLAIILATLGAFLRIMAALYGGLLCFVLSALVRFALYRCPHCHKQLKQHTGLRCPHCGEWLTGSR